MLFRIYRAAEERETIPEGSNPCRQVAMNRKRRSASAAREAWTLGCDDTGAPLPTGRARLAVLIDGENASPRHAETVFKVAGRLGDAVVRRLYGDFSNGRLATWDTAVRNFAIVTYHQPAHVRGKNAADIALVVDAMDLMHGHRLDGFVLVSSDSDFTRLAQRIREGGFAVYGLGEGKTPRAFRAACHRFGIVGNGAGTRPGRGIQVQER